MHIFFKNVIVNTVSLLYVATNLVDILREIHYKAYITQVYETVHRLKIYIYVHFLSLLPYLISSVHHLGLFKNFLKSVYEIPVLTQTKDLFSIRNINQLMLFYFYNCHVTYNTLYFNMIFTSGHEFC